ncbi:MAG TPA: ParB/RepB/Spo0J family partition protein [Actinobacteria bacterium]|jgi:ParB family chromosome partitioning protein|nr:ParB/RepB/Spo0J family partition protein [Actinomycetota bacterium]
MAQRGLGRGLGALIPNISKTSESSEINSSSILDISIDVIEPNKNQPRRNFFEDSLHELSESIKQFGVIQPITVRKIDGEEKYEIIAGERRFRAARMAGLTTVPAIINTNVDDNSSLAMALIENIHREDLSPVEQALTFKQLLEEFKLTHDELSRQVGKSRALITNTLRILSLPISIQKLIDEGKVTAGHAKALASLKKTEDQLQIAEDIVKFDLSVREVEKLVNKKKSLPEARKNREIIPLSKFSSISEKLSGILNTPVKIIQGKKKGKIEIEFGSIGDFERIVEKISGNI